MKNSKLTVFLASTLLAIGVTAVFAADRGSSPSQSSQWQHLAFETIASLNAEGAGQKINELGRDGWELVSVVPKNDGGSTRKYVYFFKKPLN